MHFISILPYFSTDTYIELIQNCPGLVVYISTAVNGDKPHSEGLLLAVE